MKSILPGGPLKTKLIILNYNNHDKKLFLQIVIIIIKENSSILPSGPLNTKLMIIKLQQSW